MTILKIPTPLRYYTDGKAEVQVNGVDVSAAMQDLVEQYPALEQHLYNGKGDLNNDIADRRRIHNLLDKTTKFMNQAITKEQFSRLDYFRGVSFLQEKKYGQAEQYFRESIKKWPHPDNPSRKKLDGLLNSSQTHS